MTILQTEIDPHAEKYLLEYSQFNNQDLEPTFNSAHQFPEPYMQISKLQATALQFFVTTLNIHTIIEVGTFVGFSIMAMAKVMNPDHSNLTTLETNTDFYHQATTNQNQYLLASQAKGTHPAGAIANINFLNTDAYAYLANLTTDEAAQINLLFLDGDKANYPAYLEWAIEKLSPKSYLLIDNALFKGQVISEESLYARKIREMTNTLKECGKFDYFFLPVGDCMIVAQKK